MLQTNPFNFAIENTILFDVFNCKNSSSKFHLTSWANSHLHWNSWKPISLFLILVWTINATCDIYFKINLIVVTSFTWTYKKKSRGYSIQNVEYSKIAFLHHLVSTQIHASFRSGEQNFNRREKIQLLNSQLKSESICKVLNTCIRYWELDSWSG